jgi:HEAT repeat protein
VQQALPVIEAAAQSSETISLQISAIGALGVMGGANDISLLQNLLQGNEERLKLPARTAINQIQQRLQPQVSVR